MHTPGPWKRCDCASAHILGLNGGQIAEIGVHGDPLGEVDEANARLIAAAPDLLLTLRRVYEYYAPMTIFDDETEDSGHDQMMSEVLSAIAQATGEGARDA